MTLGYTNESIFKSFFFKVCGPLRAHEGTPGGEKRLYMSAAGWMLSQLNLVSLY